MVVASAGVELDRFGNWPPALDCGLPSRAKLLASGGEPVTTRSAVGDALSGEVAILCSRRINGGGACKP